MRAFDSIAKKLAIPAFVLFEVGWIVYTGGFGSLLHETARVLQGSISQSADEVFNTPVLFPHYFTLVGGQFVALLFLIHAALPLSIISSIVGVLSSILSIIFFVSVGYLIHSSVPLVSFLEQSVRLLQETPDYSTSDALQSNLVYLHAARCMLTGAILMTISWGLIQVLSFFYESQTDSQNQRSLWRVIREFAANVPTSISQLKASRGELLRLCIIPLLVLSAVGWSVCVAGLYKISDIAASQSTSSSYTTTTRSPESQLQYDFGTSAIFIAAPLLYLAALLHAGCPGDTGIMSGIFAAILNTFLVVNMGYKVVDISRTKYLESQTQTSSYDYYYNIIDESQRAIMYNNNLILGGGVVCLFFWTVVYAAWNFYHAKGSRDHVRLQPNGSDDHSQIVSHVQQYAYDTSIVPEQQLPPYAKHMEAEMQPVAN